MKTSPNTPRKRKWVRRTGFGSELVSKGGKRVYLPVDRFSKGKTRQKGKESLSKLKKELDRLFSLYIRAKYEKVCFTCGKPGLLQNGHFIVRQYLATRWDEDNCRPQCFACNIRGKGRTADFEEHLVEEIGSERVAAIKLKRKELWKLDRNWYSQHIEEYKAKLKELSPIENS